MKLNTPTTQTGAKNNTNNREARNLTNLLRSTLQANKHDHIGSSLLWQQHWHQLYAMERLLQQAQTDLLVSIIFVQSYVVRFFLKISIKL